MKLSEYISEIKELFCYQRQSVLDFGYCVLLGVEYKFPTVLDYEEAVVRQLEHFVDAEDLVLDITIDEAMELLKS